MTLPIWQVLPILAERVLTHTLSGTSRQTAARTSPERTINGFDNRGCPRVFVNRRVHPSGNACLSSGSVPRFLIVRRRGVTMLRLRLGNARFPEDFAGIVEPVIEVVFGVFGF